MTSLLSSNKFDLDDGINDNNGDFQNYVEEKAIIKEYDLLC